MGRRVRRHSAAQAAAELAGGTFRAVWRTPGSKASQRGEPRAGKQETWPQPGSKHGAGIQRGKRGERGVRPGDPATEPREGRRQTSPHRPNRRETVLG